MKFKSFTLRELLLESRDGDWGKNQPKEGHTPYRVIRGGDFPDVENGFISKVPRCYLKESTVSRRTLQPDDLIIETAGGTRDRPTGRVIYISEEVLNKFDLPTTCASFARFLRLDSDKVNPKYIFWLLRLMHKRGEMWKHQLQHTGVARFQFTQFADSEPLLIPERVYQDRIVSFLDSLTDKLLVNRRMNRTLEAMAQAIFKCWFVDFEPVKAKQQARAAGESVQMAAMMALSGKSAAEIEQLPAAQQTSLAETAALFPERLVASELRLIPEGWEIGTISDLFELHRGFDLPKAKRVETGDVPVYSAGGIHSNHNESKVSAPGVVTGRSGVIGNVFISLKDFWPLNTTLYVREFRACGPYYAFHFLQTLDLPTLNSGSAVPSLNRNFVHSQPASIPPNVLKTVFENQAEKLFLLIKQNEQQAQSLAEIRDALLPKLLSGELSVEAV
ncbi:MAG: restriction endonuclease subunit S [Cyanobacteria bacterium P01_A01_bin.15]